MPPYVPFAPLTLPPDAAIDLQTHTVLSDGQWAAPTPRLWAAWLVPRARLAGA